MHSEIYTLSMSLNSEEKSTFKLHGTYMAIEGVILGVLALNEFVFIKSLHGSNYQLSFLFQFSMVMFLFLVFINGRSGNIDAGISDGDRVGLFPPPGD